MSDSVVRHPDFYSVRKAVEFLIKAITMKDVVNKSPWDASLILMDAAEAIRMCLRPNNDFRWPAHG